MSEFIWNSTYKNIPDELLRWFETLPNTKIYHAKETIYLEGDDANLFYYLKKGLVRVYVTSENGSKKILTIYKSHHVFGEASFFDGMPRMSSAEAIEESEVVLVNKESMLLCFQKQPTLALAMIESLSKTVRMLSSQIHQMSFMSADKRIIQFLLLETSNDNNLITYTQEEIGALVGCSRVTVSRVINDLKKQGFIQTIYGGIRISKSELLKKHLT